MNDNERMLLRAVVDNDPKKAHAYAKLILNNITVVLLIPARTDTVYFHDYIYLQPNVEIRFIRGRLKFGDGKNSAPFPSMVVIFR